MVGIHPSALIQLISVVKLLVEAKFRQKDESVLERTHFKFTYLIRAATVGGKRVKQFQTAKRFAANTLRSMRQTVVSVSLQLLRLSFDGSLSTATKRLVGTDIMVCSFQLLKLPFTGLSPPLLVGQATFSYIIVNLQQQYVYTYLYIYKSIRILV